MRAIDRDTQNLGIVPGEAARCRIQARDLAGSNRGERKRVEHRDDVLPAQIRQLDLRPKVTVELKIGRLRANLERCTMIGRGRAAFLNRHGPIVARETKHPLPAQTSCGL